MTDRTDLALLYANALSYLNKLDRLGSTALNLAEENSVSLTPTDLERALNQVNGDVHTLMESIADLREAINS